MKREYKEFYTEENLKKMYTNIKLDEDAPVYPPRTNQEWLVQQAEKFKKMISEILILHKDIIDKDVYESLKGLQKGYHLESFSQVPSLRSIQSISSDRLIHFVKPLEAEINNIVRLHDWCYLKEKEYKKHSPVMAPEFEAILPKPTQSTY